MLFNKNLVNCSWSSLKLIFHKSTDSFIYAHIKSQMKMGCLGISCAADSNIIHTISFSHLRRQRQLMTTEHDNSVS